MIIKKLQIENFRNITSADAVPHPVLNVVYGDNGAGKTSILESLVVLSRGRSFRTTKAGELIGSSNVTFRLFAISEDQQGKESRLGLERSGKHWRGRKNGQDLSQLSQLTRSLPLVLMEPDSHQLISGPPEFRRKYLDWGVFHVEHQFLDIWRKYSKALKQRNAALRSRQANVLDSLDQVLIEFALQLDSLRRSHSEDIAKRLHQQLITLSSGLLDINLEYRKGWKEKDFRESLIINRERDLERGVTVSGPHRADLLIFSQKAPARAVLSRGEKKMLAAALLFTQAQILAERGEKPLVLLDDLVSEFDKAHFEKALTHALGVGGQVWITGTEVPSLDHPHKVFHVEQGAVREVV